MIETWQQYTCDGCGETEKIVKYLNIDMMGNEYQYDTSDVAINMSYRMPYRWKVIAFPVNRA